MPPPQDGPAGRGRRNGRCTRVVWLGATMDALGHVTRPRSSCMRRRGPGRLACQGDVPLDAGQLGQVARDVRRLLEAADRAIRTPNALDDPERETLIRALDDRRRGWRSSVPCCSASTSVGCGTSSSRSLSRCTARRASMIATRTRWTPQHWGLAVSLAAMNAPRDEANLSPACCCALSTRCGRGLEWRCGKERPACVDHHQRRCGGASGHDQRQVRKQWGIPLAVIESSDGSSEVEYAPACVGPQQAVAIFFWDELSEIHFFRGARTDKGVGIGVDGR